MTDDEVLRLLDQCHPAQLQAVLDCRKRAPCRYVYPEDYTRWCRACLIEQVTALSSLSSCPTCGAMVVR